ncbi:MAG: alpha/beta hydrolase [Ktedonobacteraceae bacterium]|nr:alpha/beta hydrolase [Ktedonobacteraceae bacterium]
MLTLSLLLGLMLFLSISMIGIAGWLCSEELLRVKKSERVYLRKVRVIGITAETITLQRTRNTAYDGIYGIDWQSHYAVVGKIIARTERTVTRKLLKATQVPAVGARVRWNIFVYAGDPERALGLAYEDVRVPSQQGPLPAWFLPGPRTTWVLMVHGYNATREEGLRVLPRVAGLGFPVLNIAYRNDAGAPLSADRLYHLGDTEWQDVEASVQYALEHGARDLILYGWSMGGCIVETFLHRSSYVTHIQAVILDSPILSWHAAAVRVMHETLHLPLWFIRIVEWIIARRGVNFAALNYLPVAHKRTLPTLLFHGTIDSRAPVTASDTFVQACPDLVIYQRIPGVDHVQAWNADPQAYEHALTTFFNRASEFVLSGGDEHGWSHL